MSRTAKTETANNLKIFEDVIRRITELAAADVDGVRGFVTSKVDFAGLFIRAGQQSLIDVKTGDGSAEISLGINVSGKCKVKSTAEKVQQRVKDDVQSMTGIAVTKVSVYIYGIVFDDEDNGNSKNNE